MFRNRFGSYSAGNEVEAIQIQTYNLPNKGILKIVKGSVVDFASKKGAIVNSADEICLKGGGVCFAISNAGGPKLLADRKALPELPGGIRCPKGQAKLTGPNRYGRLRVPYVIHSVGPNYKDYGDDDVDTPNGLLRSAYQSALKCACDSEHTKRKPIQKVAFSLISAGRFKGNQTLEHVLGVGVQAIYDWCKDDQKENGNLEQIILYAYNTNEVNTLTKLCDSIFGQNGA